MTPAKPGDKFLKVAQNIFPGSKVLRTWSLKGGISAGMTAFEVEDGDGLKRKAILRMPRTRSLAENPQAAETEYRLLQLIHSMGLPTQAPYLLDISGEILPSPYLVLSYIEGQPDFSPTDIQNFTHQMAGALAQIHRMDRSKVDLSFLPAGRDELVEGSADLPRKGTFLENEGELRKILSAAWPLNPRNPQVLLHGDFWPGNLLWEEDQLTAVIDWEDAHTGDPLSDLAICRLDLCWIMGIEALDAFTTEYLALMPVDITDLPYWDLHAVLRLSRLVGNDLEGWAEFFHAFGRRDITADTIWEAIQRFSNSALSTLVS